MSSENLYSEIKAANFFFEAKFNCNKKKYSLNTLSKKNISIKTYSKFLEISIAEKNICKAEFFIRPISLGKITISARIKNLSRHPLELHEITLLGCKDKILNWKLDSFFANKSHFNFYKFGYQSWSPSFWAKNSNEYFKIITPPAIPESSNLTQEEFTEILENKHNWNFKLKQDEIVQDKNKVESEWMTVLADKNMSLNIGFTTFKKYFSIIEIEKNKNEAVLTAKNMPEGQLLMPSEIASSEKLLLEISKNPHESLNSYAKKTAKSMRATGWKNAPTGWCSWYYYFKDISQDEFIKNLLFLKNNKKTFPLEYVQLDDGYQKDIGDWLEINSKFPNGLKWLAGKIKEAGFKPGIWIAPFLVSEESELFKNHPDWVIKNKSGVPALAIYNWGKKNFGLDCTKTEVQNFLAGIFKKLLDYGFEYFKIDFIYAGALRGVYQNPEFTRFQAYRKGLEIIRKTLKDKFILGCGAPLGPSIGMINGNRIGPDVTPYWGENLPAFGPSTFYSMQNTISRSHLHKTWWLNDPDCLMARFKNTELTEKQVKFLASVIYLSGGILFNSDNLPELNESELSLFKKILKRNEKPALALDCMENQPPEIYYRKIKNQVEIGVFNWGNKAINKTIEFSKLGLKSNVKYSLHDIMEEKNIGNFSKKIKLKLLPHSSKLLRIKFC